MPRDYRKGISQAEAFAMLEQAAAGGLRCPVSRTGGLTSQLTSGLARAGKIRIDVYPHNWRVVTILTGQHAGKTTAPPPNSKWRPYLTIQKETPPRAQPPRISP
ncbi:hypothetical protein H8A97_30425 [Bradyrhizobium sp. Arg62]|uniref:hypothetical protein n=1 Tax=Bradyrhizobium brasilense TaxID=1419277 RepID=UPI001E304E1A|nr:hypothetical protein [Bradyrhizobium brasilense]MCC8949302.1 hypothetical protein [Bradyrhizobium brasilense]